MAHTLILGSLTTICSHRTISSEKIKMQNKSFQVSPFRTLHVSSVCSQTCSGLKRNKKNKQKKKRNKDWGFGGLQGVKFKFVIPHVQVNIKMLQLVQLSCRQDRFRAGRVPP